MNKNFTKSFSRTLMLAFVMNLLYLPAMAESIVLNGLKYESIWSATGNECRVYPESSAELKGDVEILEEVTMGNGVTYTVTTIGDSSEGMYYKNFSGCSLMTSITLPKSLKTLSSGAFQNCSALEKVTFLPTNTVLKDIYLSTFENCTSLKEINIPASVKRIMYKAFKNCPNLVDVYIEGSTLPQLETDNGSSPDYIPVFDESADITVYIENEDAMADETKNWNLYADEVVETKDVAATFIDFNINGTDNTLDKFYGTFFSDMPVRLTDGVIGYIATGVVDGMLQMDARYEGGTSNDIVPANTAIILAKTESSSGEFEALRFSEVQGIEAPTGNLLHGVAVETVIPDEANYTFYKLSYAPGSNRTKIGFYYAAENGRGGFAAPAHKAYLKVPTVQAANVKGFAFKDAAVTGIESVETDFAKEERIYTLQGIRVERPLQKGIYIVNGKKLIVK